MATPFGLALPHWVIEGVISEKRALKTKDGRIFSHSIKVVGMGGTFETQTNEEKLVESLHAGMAGVATGGFDSYQGNLKLTLSKFVEAK